MKFTTLMMSFALVLSIASTGCRYSKSRSAGSAGDGSDDARISNIGTDDIGVETTGSLDTLANGSDDFDKLYKRCTDVDFASVYFAFDSSTIPSGEISKIDNVADYLRETTDRVVIVEGHCDERGSNEYNMSLGENRAGIVRDYLVQCGVTDDRIQTRSYGSESPAVEGHNESAWAKNRRAVFAIFQK